MVNKCTFIGNLVKDPDLRYTPGGTAVCKFVIAVSMGKDKEGKDYPAQFPKITTWGKRAEVCGEYLKKGNKVYVETKYSQSKYEKDGVTHYASEFTAEAVEFLTPRGTVKKEGTAQPADEPLQDEGIYSDVPF